MKYLPFIAIFLLTIALTLNVLSLQRALDKRDQALEQCIKDGGNRVIDDECVVVKPLVK